jgi:hypothetical protein
VFFVGFGHFGQVRADIEKLARMGFNLIQIERGVWDILPEEGQVNLKPIERMCCLCCAALQTRM